MLNSMTEPKRWTERQGDTVRWGNMIGPYEGQTGEWRFASEEDAEMFAHYAGDGFPALSDEALQEAGIPAPVAKAKGDTEGSAGV